MTDWHRQSRIFLPNYAAAETSAKQFSKELNKCRKLEGLGLWVRTTTWWLITLFVLYALIAYRPAVTKDSGGVLWHVQQGANQEANTGEAVREYIGRMSGLIPAQCAVTENSMNFSDEQSTISSRPIALDILSDGLRLFGIEAVSEQSSHCDWRRDWKSIVIFLSPDVGPIQKFSLFLLVLGLLLLRRYKRELSIDAAVFPSYDPAESDVANTSGDRRLAQHPIAIVHERDVMAVMPFYPVPSVRLDELRAVESETKEYKNNLQTARSKIAPYGKTGPFDLVIDVVDAGAASGRVGDADKRMRDAIFEYGQKLQGKLWPVNYVLWLLPTIGFLGTIYGISTALVRAKGLFGDADDSAFAVKIQEVVDGLGVAFDTTSMALICSAILYYSFVKRESEAESLVQHAQTSLSNVLIERLYDRKFVSEADSNSEETDETQESSGNAHEFQQDSNVHHDLGQKVGQTDPRADSEK